MNIQVEEVALSLCGPCNQCTVMSVFMLNKWLFQSFEAYECRAFLITINIYSVYSTCSTEPIDDFPHVDFLLTISILHELFYFRLYYV